MVKGPFHQSIDDQIDQTGCVEIPYLQHSLSEKSSSYTVTIQDKHSPYSYLETISNTFVSKSKRLKIDNRMRFVNRKVKHSVVTKFKQNGMVFVTDQQNLFQIRTYKKINLNSNQEMNKTFLRKQ